MKPVRLICVGMPVLLVCLVWLNRRPVESQYEEAKAGQQIQKEGHFEKIDLVWEAPEEFQEWLKSYRKSDVRIDLDEGLILARERRVTMKHLIRTNPREALERAISNEGRVGLPEEISELLEDSISDAGEFERVVSCYTGGFVRPVRAPDEERFVTVNEKRYRAFTYGRRAELLTKDRISVHGILLDDVMAVSPDPVLRKGLLAESFGEQRQFASEEELDFYIAKTVADENVPGPAVVRASESLIAESTWTEGSKRILYLRVRFADQDLGYEPVSLATAQSHQDDVAEHYRIASYGKLNVTTVFPDVITLAENKSGYVEQGLGKMMDEARAAAIILGESKGLDWDYRNYDFYTIISDGGIGGYAGIAQVGGRKSHHQKGYTSLRTSGHEFGHNLGLSHAYYNYTSDLSPRGATPSNGAGRIEYGHRFSVMSAQNGSDMNNPALPHFTVHEKWRLDWVTDSDIVDITTGDQSGTYRLYQNDDQDVTGLRAIRIPSGGLYPKYWLSYRTAWRQPNRNSDNDFLLNGILFNWSGSGGGTSTLLDMTPYSDEGSVGSGSTTRDNSDKWDAPLLIGRTYTDSESNVSVTPVARGGTAPNEYIDVHVHLATGNEVPLVGENDDCTAIVPDSLTATGTDWTALDFDDSGWPFSGLLGVGYDTNSNYLPYFGVDVRTSMRNTSESCYIRIPFNINEELDLANISSLKLRMRYDDGFVAYLNGVKIAEDNAPGSLEWDSGAARNRRDSLAEDYQEFIVDLGLAALVPGENVLAIHGLNNGSASSDFLIQPKLSAVFEGGTNRSPTVSLTANTLAVSVGQEVAFTANGSDPDGDALAYAWDYDIGNEFAPEGLNQANASRRWSRVGWYAVTVTCSDRKGGISRDRVLVKVGNPSSNGVVSGRVLQGGLPVAGARVSVEGSDQQSITMEDGTYLLADLSTASQITIKAMQDGEVFQSSMAMPVTPRLDLEGVDFWGHRSVVPRAPTRVLTVTPRYTLSDVATPVQLTAQVWNNTQAESVFVPMGDTWNYLDTGVNPGTSWMDESFDDSAWASGVAELGYGDSQATVVSYGSNAADKHTTTWFRRRFSVTDVSEVSRLKLSVKRDDGVRVFLNGSEIARDNLTLGTVSSGTEAWNEISSTYEEILIHFSVDPELLVEGGNVIAAEIHQEDAMSSDLSFDLELSGSRNLGEVTPIWSVAPEGADLSLTGEFSASLPGNYTVTAVSDGVEATALISVASDNVISIAALDGFLWENGAATSTVEVTRSGSIEEAFEVSLVVNGDAISGVDFSGVPESVIIPAGQASVGFEVSIIDDSLREGREAIFVTPVATDLFAVGSEGVASITIIDDELAVVEIPDAGLDVTVVVNTKTNLAGLIQSRQQFVAAGDYWKFDDQGFAPTAGWKGLPYLDGDWQIGLAKFGYGDDDEITKVSYGGVDDQKQITTYFRRRFYLNDPADYSALTTSLLVDDGAVIYLNGNEVERINMDPGEVTYSTPAKDTIGGDDEKTFFDRELSPLDLVAGENVIAVEVHQRSQTSSDLAFDLTLDGTRASGLPLGRVKWMRKSGPGTVTFGDDENLSSSVLFDQVGTHVLSLETESGEVDEITVLVEAAQGHTQGYAQWITDYTLIDEAALADPDFDGVCNLMEYATGGNPEKGGDAAISTLVEDSITPGDLLFTYRRLRGINLGDASGETGNGYSIYGLNYMVQVSNNLIPWTSASASLAMQVEGAPVDNGDGTESVMVRLTPPSNSNSDWFVRLRIEQE
ncbi:PKD domain-containing protein [Akkermansiaceae bacterium]|nr:PKD domain-containing protein [Akkermansiaceae bacterium]